MNKLLFKILLFWFATKAKFWDFCLDKVLKHHPTHQYDCKQLELNALEYKFFFSELGSKSQTYKQLLGAYMRVLQKTSFENINKIIAEYDQMQRTLENQRQQMSFIHSQNLHFATKISKCNCHSK